MRKFELWLDKSGDFNNWNKPDEMYNVLSNTRYIQNLEEQDKGYHPVKIILWKYAHYCAGHGMINAATKFYEKAAEVCI